MKEKKLPKDIWKAFLVADAEFSDHFEFPVIKKTNLKATRAIPFDKALKIEDFEQWVHFYIHDQSFERIWNNPKQYLNRLKKFQGIITPDFSLYRDMPLVMQMWNTYRNRSIGAWLQTNGVPVIPNIRWGDERTYEFCFEGIEPGGTVAISTNGCIQKKDDKEYFKQGLKEMISVLHPQTIINYSYMPDSIFLSSKQAGIELIQIENYILTTRKKASS